MLSDQVFKLFLTSFSSFSTKLAQGVLYGGGVYRFWSLKKMCVECEFFNMHFILFHLLRSTDSEGAASPRRRGHHPHAPPRPTTTTTTHHTSTATLLAAPTAHLPLVRAPYHHITYGVRCVIVPHPHSSPILPHYPPVVVFPGFIQIYYFLPHRLPIRGSLEEINHGGIRSLMNKS